jgi:hypothetical protein
VNLRERQRMRRMQHPLFGRPHLRRGLGGGAGGAAARRMLLPAAASARGWTTQTAEERAENAA